MTAGGGAAAAAGLLGGVDAPVDDGCPALSLGFVAGTLASRAGGTTGFGGGAGDDAVADGGAEPVAVLLDAVDPLHR